MTNPLMDGGVNAQFSPEPPQAPENSWGFDSMGINDNFQATDHASVDRHII